MSPRSGRSPNGGLASRRGWIGSVARFWETTYAADYVGLVALITAYILVGPIHRCPWIRFQISADSILSRTISPNVLSQQPQHPIPPCACRTCISWLEYILRRRCASHITASCSWCLERRCTQIPSHYSWVIRIVCQLPSLSQSSHSLLSHQDRPHNFHNRYSQECRGEDSSRFNSSM